MISVIVPVYNVEPWLRQCLDSIVGQTYGDLEILLVDDGSTDRCGAVCEEYARADARIRVFHTENRGLSAARNLGLREAKGELIGFVDADDRVEPEMYAALLEAMEETGADVSVCGVRYGAAVPAEGGKREVWSGEEALTALLDRKINNGVWNKLYRRRLFRDVVFPEGMNYEDVFVMHRILGQAGRVTRVPYIGYHYRQRPGSITDTNTVKNLLDYADAYLARYRWFQENRRGLFEKKREQLLLPPARGICKVWRWWHGCSEAEKAAYRGRIVELSGFARDTFPRFGRRGWPLFLRASAPFLRSTGPLTFAGLYYMNRAYCRLKRGKREGLGERRDYEES